MPITYYPESIIKKRLHVTEQLQKARTILSDDGRVDLTASGMSYYFWHPSPSWIIHEILLHLGAATAKNYSVNKAIGRGVISKVNDLLYFAGNQTVIQPIYLSQGFYKNGTVLATELQTQLNANQAFIDTAIAPCAVVYVAATGKFTITTNAGDIKYFNVNIERKFYRDSTGGEVFGFTADSASSNSIQNDLAVFGLGNVISIVTATANTSIDIWASQSPAYFFDVDHAINIEISAIATTVDYKIIYGEYF